MQFDVREDEEQSVKLGQTIELLLAAGYFRARIHGLSPFDKVIYSRVGVSVCPTDKESTPLDFNDYELMYTGGQY